jgi:hypothetical protein
MRNYNLDLDRLSDFEVGAQLVALLAFPAEAEADKRQRAAEAMSALAVWGHIQSYPEYEHISRRLHGPYLEIEVREIRRRLRTLRRRLRDRMVAARMAVGFVYEAMTGSPAPLPAGVAKHTLTELSHYVLRQSGQADAERVIKRTWPETKPVIGLAMAFLACARQCFPDGEISVALYPLWDSELHATIIAMTRDHEEYVLADRRFGIDPEDFVRLRATWTPPIAASF